MKRILSIALACVILFTSLSFAKESEEKPMRYEMKFATVTNVPDGDYEEILVDNEMDKDVLYISRLCDKNNIPYASNIATAEMLVLGLARGDLDWREVVNPKSNPFTA
mgnify:CR=1 FL=1